MGFVSDQLSNGRRFRTLNIVDDYSREMVGQFVDFSITGAQVARFLDQLSETRVLPDKIVCDNVLIASVFLCSHPRNILQSKVAA